MAAELAASMPLLKPIVALNLWVFVIEGWMYYVRIPAVKKYDVQYTRQFTKEYMNSKFPPEVRWPGGKYSHARWKCSR